MAAVKWYVGKLKLDAGRYKAGEAVPFKGDPVHVDYGHLFSQWSGPYKTKMAAWQKARG